MKVIDCKGELDSSIERLQGLRLSNGPSEIGLRNCLNFNDVY